MEVTHPLFGIYRGIIQHIDDPLKKGRVRLRIPQVLANEITDWVWLKETPMLRTSVPKIGQGVWIMFEGGNASYPLWIGTFGKNVDSKKVLPLVSTLDSKPSSYSNLVFKEAFDGTELDITNSIVAMDTLIDGGSA